MFPVGTHRARPIDAALGMTGTGKEQIAILFESAENPGDRITWYGYFTDATFDRTIESLRHLGWTGNDLLDFHHGLPDGVENEVEIVVEDEADQNGEPQRRVKWINSGRGIAVKQVLDDAQARAFSARMKAKVAALRVRDGSRTPPPSARQPAAAAARNESDAGDPFDDEIPL